MWSSDLGSRQSVIRVVEPVDSADCRILFQPGVSRPVTSGGDHDHRARSGKRPDLHVFRVDAQVWGILTETPALHDVGDHIDRTRKTDPGIDRRDEKCLCSATRFASHSDSGRVDLRQGLQQVDRADAVPELHAKEIDAPERLPVRLVRLSRALTPFAVSRGEAVADRRAVVVTDHVVTERNIALHREVGGPTSGRIEVGVLEAAIGPVAVRAEDGRNFLSIADLGPVKVAGNIKARIAFKVDLLDRISSTVDAAEDDRIEGPLLRHGEKAGRTKDLLP